MSVASHLAVSPQSYDRRIRALIPHYDDAIAHAAGALGHAARPIRRIVDLGIGTGVLARACLERQASARVWGIDADAAMMAMARQRLGPLGRRVTFHEGNFVTTPLPACDAVVASFSLHHVRSRAEKLRFYRRCRKALRPGGLLVSADCFPPSSPAAYADDVDRWIAHLSRTFGTTQSARRVFESWADEDTYMRLSDEIQMLGDAGFDVDVTWRQSPFAVVVGLSALRR